MPRVRENIHKFLTNRLSPRARLVIMLGGLTLIAGAGFLGKSFADYSEYSERTKATVTSSYHTDGNRDHAAETHVSVDYTVEGLEREDVELEDQVTEYDEGETITVAYIPGDPREAIDAQLATEDPYSNQRYMGIACLLISAVIFTVGGISIRRKHRRG